MNFKMQMRAGRMAGVAHHADLLALLDDLAFLHADALQVAVYRLEAVAVINDDMVAEPSAWL